MESLKCMSPEKCVRILQSGPVFNFRVSFVLCLFFFFFLQFTQVRHQHDEVFLLHVFNSLFRSHSESRFSTSACVAKDFYDARHPYYTYIYIYSSFGPVFNLLGVTAAIGCSSVV